MATNWAGRYTFPMGCSHDAFGGAVENMHVDALKGWTDFVTVFDDFNGHMVNDAFGDVAGDWELNSWVLTDVGAATANDTVGMNDVTGARWDSCIRINTGDGVDSGGNMQLDFVNGTTPTAATSQHPFDHIWLPDSGAAAAADGLTFVFACRLGVVSNAVTFDGKFFIGWADAGDTTVMAPLTGAIVAATGPLVGFHLDGDTDNALYGISQRTAGTAFAEGTNRETLQGAACTTGYTAGETRWYNLAVRMTVVDRSEATGNGFTQFYWLQEGGGANRWAAHPTVLVDQVPHSATVMVPTIEAINGPTNESDFLLDWWAFGVTREG